MTLKTELENLLHCSVDIVRLREGMNFVLKKRIQKEGIHVWPNIGYEIITLIDENLKAVLQRTKHLKSADDFTSSEAGMILLDSVCMKLIAVDESIKNLDKVTNKQLLSQYTQIQWKQAMGMRDIIVHHYFDVDAEQIYNTLKDDIPTLIDVLAKMKNELKTEKQ